MGFASVSLNLPRKLDARKIESHACTPTISPAGIAGNPLFELGSVQTQPRLSVIDLATHRPIAILALLPRPAVLFTAGALSGAVAKTITAPLDRVKILLQVRGGLEGGAIAQAAQKGNLIQSLIAVGRQEGLLGYWKGNLPQVLRVVPYSAAQLYSYEVFKQWFADSDGHLTVRMRLAAGAAAGMTATLVSHE